ncbi:MAG: hypothetical protein D6E12_17165 [Desulfovibrio sp.]|nr:MAG: hypothetical protein D6E12_17165 [Desulfovibrio sp.]
MHFCSHVPPALRFFSVLLLAVASIAPVPAQAQDTQPFVGEYQLNARGNEGDMTISYTDGVYVVSIFTTNDNAAHFCSVEEEFVQEETVLVQASPAPGSLPLIIFHRGDYLEIEDNLQGACGMNQSLAGKYYQRAHPWLQWFRSERASSARS